MMTANDQPTADNQPLTDSPLWIKARECSDTARKSGELCTIPTKKLYLEENHIQFLIRQMEERQWRKPSASEQKKRTNPFLPYNSALKVMDLGVNHVCLLNKFNVCPNHLLIISKAFEPQNSPLTFEDFLRLWDCLDSYPSLGFFNSDPASGASQPHKHLQTVPLPMEGGADQLPITPLLNTMITHPVYRKLSRFPRLPWEHGAVKLRYKPGDSATMAEQTYEGYCNGMDAFEVFKNGKISLMPYNLLITREWLLVIPRRCDDFRGISVNALGFAGSFFVSNQTELEILRQTGPLNLLKSVAYPLNSK